MSDTIEAKGHCLCGAVRFTAKSLKPNVGACHCSTCRRWGGGPLMVVDCGSEVAFEDEKSITVYDSSQWAERGFCNRCGSHLFYRLKTPVEHMIPVGLFEADERFVFDHQVFIDEKPSFYCFANETQDMTGPEVFAKYAPPS
jgi:hypothetical protein